MEKHPSYVAWLETATPEQIAEDQTVVEWLLDLARDPYKAPELKSRALYDLACRGIDPYADDPPPAPARRAAFTVWFLWACWRQGRVERRRQRQKGR